MCVTETLYHSLPAMANPGEHWLSVPWELYSKITGLKSMPYEDNPQGSVLCSGPPPDYIQGSWEEILLEDLPKWSLVKLPKAPGATVSITESMTTLFTVDTPYLIQQAAIITLRES